ncbi:Eukaryotic initiation factor 4E family protein [Trichomonas vaginalis G3]|uniref:Eukaryotic initiation factor 4E family protein n=1 Tax=Trichomonas vaginalis (strain ATCC PRA-98 / G3) TaxID=412133 RepID=A2FLM1_TRIV3|nr:translation initiation factor protein [Trichomonas vaginalis G3]EAX94194.1 Eukaryotic initiation factor 4E family protein [Trichomonas vaginalis G3]KAI5498405.1 translation initiation factor protein [Trichomonas vaginalis G3]|eukprot:XP_001307124.1 Eukaryotic initiation factor 4E family protein [Trichomonas vaginalis G3]
MTTKHLVEGVSHHALSKPWTFSYCIPSGQGKSNIAWEKFIHPLTDFSSYEDFFAIYNSIEPPSDLPKACRYYVFQKGIQPMWEDQANQNGTQYTVEIPNPNEKNKEKGVILEAQNKWLDLVLSVFTTFPVDKINGIEYNNRGTTIRLGVWTRKLENDKEKDEIAAKIKEVLGPLGNNLEAKPMQTAPANENQPRKNGGRGHNDRRPKSSNQNHKPKQRNDHPHPNK